MSISKPHLIYPTKEEDDEQIRKFIEEEYHRLENAKASLSDFQRAILQKIALLMKADKGIKLDSFGLVINNIHVYWEELDKLL